MGTKTVTIWKQRLHKLCAFCVGLVGILLVTPLLIFLIIPFMVYRRILFYSAKCLRPDLGKMLNACGTLMGFENVYKSPRMKIVTGWVLEGCPTKQEVLDGMKSTIETIDKQTGDILYPELTQSLEDWMGYRFWKPVRNFDLKDYVEYVDNQENPLSYKKGISLLEEEGFVPFEKNKPLWKLMVFTNYIPDESFAYARNDTQYSFVVLCYHHCLADGYSYLNLIPRVFQFLKMKPKKSETLKPKPFCREIFNCLSFLVRIPCDLGEFVLSQKLGSKFWTPEVKDGREKGVVSKVPGDKHLTNGAFSDLIPFSTIKEIRNIHGVTSIAVIVAGIAGSIRSSMFKNSLKIPKGIPFSFPILLPNHPEKLRNHVTGISLTLPVGEADPLKRLVYVNRTILNLKKSTLPFIFRWAGFLLGSLPPALMNIQVEGVSKKHMAAVSSLPGPSEEVLSYGKYPMKDVMGGSCGAWRTKCLTAAFTTYAGNGRLVVGADPSVICSEQQATEIINGFVNELNVLLKVESCKLDFGSENV